MIVSSERLGLPKDEESIFDLMGENKILGEEMCEKAKEMKGFRNIQVHRYVHVDDELVYNDLKDRLADFYKFESEIRSYLKRQRNL